jgi:hypothetical protein
MFQRVILPVITVVFGAVFLLLLWVVVTGRSTLGSALAPLALTGILAAATAAILVSERRRAASGPSLEVDARGIRVAGMPRLAWPDVREVRAESIVGFGGGDHDADDSGTTLSIGGLEIPLDRNTAEHRIGVGEPDTGQAKVYRRLGIVPRDPLLVRRASGISGALGGVVGGLREMSLQRMGGRAIELAPFGVYDYELDAPFDEVVARVRDFHEVVEISELGSDVART